jgi:plasmid stabilization system protein ParE
MAKNDLREILLDIAKDSPIAAERLRDQLLEGLQALGQSPGIGHFHEELLDQRYRFWNFHSFVVAYAWQQTPIRVISVVHGARDLGVFFAWRQGTRK